MVLTIGSHASWKRLSLSNWVIDGRRRRACRFSLPPVSIRYVYSQVNVSFTITGVTRSDWALPREVSVFRKKKKKWRVRIPLDPGSGAVVPCFTLHLWKICRGGALRWRGSSFLLSVCQSVDFWKFFFFCPHSHLTYPTYGGFWCRVSMSESFPTLLALLRGPFPWQVEEYLEFLFTNVSPWWII